MSDSPSPPRAVGFADEPDWYDDDDDMEYQPDDGIDEDDAHEAAIDEFFDADDGLTDVELALEIGDSEGPEDTPEPEAESQGRRVLSISREELLQVLGGGSFRHIFHNHFYNTRSASRSNPDADDDGDLDEAIRGYQAGRWYRQRRRGPPSFEKVPSDAGRELMDSGAFGSCERKTGLSTKKELAYRLMRRELGLGSQGTQNTVDRIIAQSMIPHSAADLVVHYDRRCYSGQFSDDGNFFFSCAQDFRVRMYDTSNPYDWKYYRTVPCPTGSWTITDASLSPDNRNLAISSINSTVYLAPTDPQMDQDPIPLEFAQRRQFHTCGIWSLRFSGDGREIVAGTSDRSVYVYDIEAQRTILQIPGHTDDVNAVCYADPNSPHVLFSGSDDTTLKVWDRRSMADNRPAGVFLGHTEGLTYVDSKGDGRYLVSNAKDQTAKLWDMRKMISADKAETIDPDNYTTGFEYRHGAYDFNDWEPHPHDCSLVTFRGHKVLRTLIRCHFSPPGSSDSRYIYSGSYDGNVYVWNLDATLAGKIDVLKATKNSREQTPDLMEGMTYGFRSSISGEWLTCVRDASWHPNAPMIAATSWNGWDHALGTCSVHSWNDGVEDDEGEPKMGRSVDAKLRKLESSPAQPRRTRRSNLLRMMMERDDDDV